MPITTFSDSQKALKEIQHPLSHEENRFLRGQIYYKAKNLQDKRHSVTFRWIPGHTSLIRNEKADLAAKSKAVRGGRQAERGSSLAHIKKNLAQAQSAELARWHEIKIQEREVSRRGFYISRLEKGMSKVLGSTSKKYASRYLRIWRSWNIWLG